MEYTYAIIDRSKENVRMKFSYFSGKHDSKWGLSSYLLQLIIIFLTIIDPRIYVGAKIMYVYVT